MRSGFAALIGRPNVGKSTLLNRLVGEKVAIVSPKPQTTRTRILGVVTRPDAQVAFFDTPGLHEAKGPLNQAMVHAALNAARECDVVLMMVDTDGLRADREPEIGPGNRYVLERLKLLRKPSLLVINKIDLVKKALLLPYIARYRDEFPFADVLPISAQKGDGVEDLFGLVSRHLPEGPPLFPPDVFTDQAERTIVGEYVREQVLRKCRQEIPYSTAVVVDHFDETEREPLPSHPKRASANKAHKGSNAKSAKAPSAGGVRARQGGGPPLAGLIRIHANIFVERDSQKAIIIGKRGAMLKEIGTDARLAIQRLLGTHVFLALQVKVEPRWSEREDALRKLGYAFPQG
jgi:GTP-binding protein Era